MRKFFLIVIFALISELAISQIPGYSEIGNLEVFKNKFTEAANKTSSIKSDFTQEKNMSMLSEKLISKGKFEYKKEDKVRMEYLSPFKYLMIINGSKVYIRDGQKENTLSTSSNKIFKQVSGIMLDCVSGSMLTNPDFKIKIFENKTDYLIEMIPVSKGIKDFFSKIHVIADKSDYGVNRVELIELSGDVTVMHFTNKQLNTNVPDTDFYLH